MMTAKTITTHKFSGTDELFFDANIWLYLHGPQGGRSSQATSSYSAAFKKIITAGASIWVDVLIMSEFANTYARLEMPRHKFNNFKQFRRSKRFPARDITGAMRRIMQHAKPVGTGFEKLNLDDLFLAYESTCPDFNDAILTRLCGSHGLTLVTHDSDFADANVAILTANPKLLP